MPYLIPPKVIGRTCGKKTQFEKYTEHDKYFYVKEF